MTMEEEFDGGVKRTTGRAKSAAGGLVGDERLAFQGRLEEAAGRAQQAYGRIKDRAQERMDSVSLMARERANEVDAFVQERPWAAVAVAAGLALVAGLLLSNRGRTVYIAPR